MVEHTTLLLNSDGNPLSFLPLSSISWKEAVGYIFSDTVSVIDEYDNLIARSPSIEVKIPAVIMLKEFVKYQRMVQYSRYNIYLRDDYTCSYCGLKDLSCNNLTLDHVLPKFHGGKTNFSNIVTACHSCNIEKSHWMRMTPKEKPKKPSYYELVNNRKKYELTIPTDKWLPYIDWDESKILIKNIDNQDIIL